MTNLDRSRTFPFPLPPSPFLLAQGVLKLYSKIDIQPPAPLSPFPSIFSLSDLPNRTLIHVIKSIISRQRQRLWSLELLLHRWYNERGWVRGKKWLRNYGWGGTL